MSDRPYVLQRKGLELVLFEEIVQILLQHLEDQTGVVLVSEALVGSNKIVFIRIFLAEISSIKNVLMLSRSCLRQHIFTK